MNDETEPPRRDELFIRDNHGWLLHGRDVSDGAIVELKLADGTWLPCRFSYLNGDAEEPDLRLPVKGDEDLGAFVDICLSENGAFLRWPDSKEAA